jgi:uncharacterized protein YqjF (DUF2071 family)
LEAFLVERYRLFALRKGVVMTGLVRHEPYMFSDVDSALVEDQLVSAAGFDVAAGQAPAHAVWSPGVDVQITAPTRLSA